MPGGGPHPKDGELFAAPRLPALRRAAAELRFLRERGYALPSAIKLVGDRHQLRERQRVAISRATSEAAGAAERGMRRLGAGQPPPGALWVDGFNVVITVETALRGGVLVTTADGGLRDLAGVHGSYRVSEVTGEALARVAAVLVGRGWRATPARWYLDAPVSNTGRLGARIREVGRAEGLRWEAEVVPDPDAVLIQAPAATTVATGDAAILDRCGPWVDLGSEVVRATVPDAWVVDLVPAEPGSEA